MDKLKKVLGFLVFPLLLLLMFFPTGEAQAADVTDKAHVDKYEITIASTGSKTEGIHGSNDTSMKLKYSGKFSFPNVAANEIKDGDYFIVKAPDNLSLTDGSLDLIDSTSNIKMGTVQVDNANHRLVFTFNDKVKDKQNIRGDFVAEATETLQKEGKTVTYVLPDGKTQTITYKVNTYQKTDVIGETITKYGYNDNNKAIAHFQMKINRAKEDMTGHVVKITDDVSKGAFANYVEGTFYMYEAEFETTNTNSSALKHLGDKYEITTDPEVYKANSDKKALLTFVNGKRGFELLMPTNMGRKSFFLTYDTSSPADTSTISNSAQYLIDNQPQLIWKKYGGSTGTRTEATFNLKTVKSVGASVTADIAGKIKITKYDEADATVKLAGVVFEILRKSDRVKVQEITTDANGVALSESLVDGEYIVKEKTPKSGYLAISKEFEVELKAGKGVPLNISNKRETVDFEATKTWVGGKKTDYKEVKLGLYVHKKGQTVADSKPVLGNYTPEVTESNGVYTYKWKNQLPKYDVDGTTELVYSVRELEDQTNLPLAETETVAGETSDYVVSYNEDKTKITNTYKPAKISVTAKKVWTGGKETVRPTVYFKLYRTPEGGAIEEVAGAAQKEVPKTDGTVEWTDLPATDEHGVKYTYSVMEVDDEGNLVTNVDGYTANQTADLTVTNTYGTSPTKADIEVKKELAGGRPTPLQNEEFEFILKDKNGQEVQRAKNDAAGRVVFKDIPFDKAGEYEFTVVEVNAGQTIDGVTYDGRTVPVTVSVTDDGKGKLVATVLYHPITAVALPSANLASSAPSSNLVPPLTGAVNRATDAGIQTFKNTYKATNAKAVLEVTKQLTGRATGAQENEFEFTLTDQAGNVETKKNDAAGKVKFHELTFDEAGTYTYTIKEVKAGTTENGITYDSKTITAKVTVTDDGHGKLTAVVDYSSDGTANSTTFTNTYNPAKVKAPVSATKSFINKNTNTPMPLKGGEFVFALLNHEGDPVEKTTNDADGNIKFKDLEFEKAGTYQYTIYEHKAGQIENGITYSNKTVEVTIEVTDDGHGALKATVSYDNDERHFENTYKAANAKANLEVTKKLTGRDTEAQDGEFEFTLTDSTGVVKDTKKNDAAGNVKFDELEFDKVGTYTYTIKEVKAGQTENGITYDSKTVTAKVTVTDDGKGNLTAVVDYSSDGTANSTTFTNVYTPAGATTVTLGAKKVLEGKALEAGKYSFVLKKEDGSVVETVTNAADGRVTFTPISYDESQVGTHKYTISEVEGSEAGITYDKTVQEVEVKVEKVSSTELKATVSKEAKDLVFKNIYTPAGATTVTLGAKKVLEGKALEAGKYSFVLKKADGTVVETVTNAADGTVTFSPISYDESQVGTHKYTISEVAGSEAGITYDKTVQEVEVKVEKVSATELKATASKEAKDLVFTNKYTPAGATSVTLGAKKVLEGKALEAGKYSFELKKEDGSVVETVTNAADGSVTFSPISYDESQVGTHKYTISEVVGSEAGITYDKTVQEVEVKVEKVSATELKATASKEAKDLVFTNKYTPAGATSVTLGAKKVLEGKALEAGKYSFVLKKEDGSVVETVTNAADGSVTFSPISYDESQVGTHKYTISEVAGSEAGITYDKTVQEVEVKVEKVSATELKATASKEAKDLVFTNKYTPAGATSVTLGAKKVLEGKALEAGKYSFVLKKEDGSVVETVTNAADGSVTFSPISYDESQVGTHKYTISEVAGSEAGITYDKTVQEVEVKVEKVSATELKATASKEAKDLVFTNKYTPAGATSVTLGAKKVLEGKALEAGKYSFVLKKEDGSVVETVTNAADGSVTFSPISYDESQVGTHKYTISEVAGSEAGITYDKTVQEVEVKVEKVSATELKATASKEAKDLVFTNKYTPAGATSVTLGAKKVLEGKALEAGKYSFVLKKEDGSVVETVKNAADGTVTFSPISYDESQVGTHKYTISEVAGSEAGITYDKTVQEVEVTVEKVSATELKATASKEAKDLVFTNKYTPAKTSVSVKKAWKDENNQDGKRPSSVTVKLLADGQDTGKTLELNAANGWAGSFTDLDADKGGTAIQYTVVEVTVPGYTSEVTGDAASGFTITNSYSPETVDIKATKNWDDANNQDGKRPTKITINLLADGQKVDSKEIQAAPDGTWSVEFTKLAKYKNGKEIKYTVTEEAVAEYDSYIKDFTITNKYTPKAIDYKVTKVWNDANDQDGKRPESVTVQLYKKVGDADPVAVEGKKLTLTAKDKTDANTWVASFTKLPQYEAGKEITYSIKEVDVPAGYKASVTGQVVTNTHNPDTVILSGTKVWNDNNNQSGKRADKVKVQIFKGEGEKAELVQEIEVSEATGWKFESKALPKYENGKEIKYTVKEVAVKEYTSTVTTDKDGKYTVTNEYTPEKTSVKGKKIWNDANNKDGIRPDSIKVKLLADGKETGKEATASEATGWTYEFTELERYKDTKGTEFKYSVVEVPVKGYTSEVEGFNITNTHTPEEPTPGEPNEPQDPEPNKPKDPEPGKPGPKPQLPNTGEKASNAAVVAGLALMAVTGGLYFVSRKNK